jgi:hypothetical protein
MEHAHFVVTQSSRYGGASPANPTVPGTAGSPTARLQVEPLVHALSSDWSVTRTTTSLTAQSRAGPALSKVRNCPGPRAIHTIRRVELLQRDHQTVFSPKINTVKFSFICHRPRARIPAELIGEKTTRRSSDGRRSSPMAIPRAAPGAAPRDRLVARPRPGAQAPRPQGHLRESPPSPNLSSHALI